MPDWFFRSVIWRCKRCECESNVHAGESDDYMSCYDAGSDIVWVFTRQQVASVAVTTNGESRVRLVGTDSDIMMDRRQTQALLGWMYGTDTDAILSAHRDEIARHKAFVEDSQRWEERMMEY